ncbi:MAG: GMC family oxidoreductase [Bryobacteraceae bacterium]
MISRCYENIVIGSGPGGATTAHLLAESGKQVLMLEEGPHLPLESCPPFSMDEMTQKYRAGGLNPALGDAKVAFAEGRTVGGGSEINSGLYHRTPDEILDRWRSEFLLRDTTSHDLLPHFLYSEQSLEVGTYPGPIPLASRKLEQGAKHLGWKVLEVPRWFKYDGTTGPDGCPRGTRQSMTKTFVPRALKAGASLLSDSRVQRLRRDGNRWMLDILQRGKSLKIEANTVYVCGSAIQTPLLLRRSGITRNVGNTLAMHPTVKAVALFDEAVNHEALGVAVHQVKEFSPRIGFGCSISSQPHLALALSDYASCNALVQSNWRHMAIYYAMITGPATGRIRGIFGLPDPLIRYQLTPQDLRDLAKGLRKLSQLLLAAGARIVLPSLAGGREIQAEDELTKIPGTLTASRSNLMTIHLFSSCPMGEDRGRCAVDSFGRVHGVPGLIVNDASIIPTAMGVNPQGTIMALARRNTLHAMGAL